jgi:hypothetical protein
MADASILREQPELEKVLRRFELVASAVAKRPAYPKNLRKLLADDTNEVLRVFSSNPEASPKALRSLKNLLRMAFWLGIMAHEIGIVEPQKLQRVALATAAKRKASETRREIIARRAAPILKKHPTWASNRIAGEIKDAVNHDLNTVGQPPLQADAIRKSVEKYRTDARSSG